MMSEKTARKKNLYLVGFDGDQQCVYGPNLLNGNASYTHAMTLKKAQKRLQELHIGDKAIYKLVRVK